jgi:putative RecB family exonuclease
VAEVYSHSRLDTFERCPRRFFYRYRAQLPPESESIEAFVGKRVHEVLERLYRAVGDGSVPSLERVIARYRQLFQDAHDPERVRIVRLEESLDSYLELGEHCLRNYYHDHYPFDRDETLGLEQRVEFSLGDLPSGPVRVQGFIDRVVRARDGALEIHDYKTSARVPSQRVIDADGQLALYQIGLTDPRNPPREVRLVWHFVRRGVTRTSTRTPSQLDALRTKILDRVERVRAETEWAAKPGPLCGWCEYRDGCPASPQRCPETAPYDSRPRVRAAVLATRTPEAPTAAPSEPTEAVDQLALPLDPGASAPR